MIAEIIPFPSRQNNENKKRKKNEFWSAKILPFKPRSPATPKIIKEKVAQKESGDKTMTFLRDCGVSFMETGWARDKKEETEVLSKIADAYRRLIQKTGKTYTYTTKGSEHSVPKLMYTRIRLRQPKFSIETNLGPRQFIFNVPRNFTSEEFEKNLKWYFEKRIEYRKKHGLD